MACIFQNNRRRARNVRNVNMNVITNFRLKSDTGDRMDGNVDLWGKRRKRELVIVVGLFV